MRMSYLCFTRDYMLLCMSAIKSALLFVLNNFKKPHQNKARQGGLKAISKKMSFLI